MHWQIRDRVLETTDRPLVMGIVNVTPDSFSDGGRFLGHEAALAHARQLIDDGADILDIGGESTRPGSQPVALEEELRRVVPIVAALAEQPIPLSVDTSKPDVARQCLQAGAAIINDVTALADDRMIDVAREFQAGVILMHMQGTPATMQIDPRYDDVVGDVSQMLAERLARVTARGIERTRIAIDPGIGFGKSYEHNLTLLCRLRELRRLGCPICLGVSRKKFIDKLRKRPADQRVAGSVAVACYAQMQEGMDIVRVHDVRETRDAVDMIAALRAGPRSPFTPCSSLPGGERKG